MAPQSVELLYFEGCPNHEVARELVERVAAEAGVEIDLRLTVVTSPEDAEQLRFLGSPSVRVNGHDVEPGADESDAFVLACRVYRADSRLRGIPSEEWVRAALRPS
jgi:predicted RNA-binding protein with PIN domain